MNATKDIHKHEIRSRRAAVTARSLEYVIHWDLKPGIVSEYMMFTCLAIASNNASQRQNATSIPGCEGPRACWLQGLVVRHGGVPYSTAQLRQYRLSTYYWQASRAGEERERFPLPGYDGDTGHGAEETLMLQSSLLPHQISFAPIH